MEFLLTSLAALLLGPALATAFRGSDRVLAGLDGFVIAAIVGLVTLHILPHAVAGGGLAVMAAAVAGLLLPSVVERRLHGRGARNASRGVIALVVIGLAIHALLDGAALALPGDHDHHHHESEVLLAFGVILHRIPVGLAIWGAARPVWGGRGAMVLVAVVAGATALGFGAGEAVLGALTGPFLGAFEALVAGSLLHVVAGHRLPALASSSPHRITAAIGAILGVVVHVVLLDDHAIPEPDAGLPAAETFSTLALLAAPAVLGGFALVAGGAWASARFAAALKSATRPVARAFRRAGAGVLGLSAPGDDAPDIAPRPMIGPLALLISLPLLGPEVSAVRVGVALLVLVGLSLLRHASRDERHAGGDWRDRFVATLDHEAPWLVAGVALAAMLEPVLSCSLFESIPAAWQAAIAVVVAAPWYLSAAGMTPLAAVLLHKGAAPGAVVAFLIVGAGCALWAPTCDDRDHRFELRRDGALAIVLALASAWIVDGLLETTTAPALHAEAALEPASVALVAAAVLALLTVVALIRQGPRGFIAQITGHGEDAHDLHDHHGHGDHDHHGHHHGDHHHPDDGPG